MSVSRRRADYYCDRLSLNWLCPLVLPDRASNHLRSGSHWMWWLLRGLLVGTGQKSLESRLALLRFQCAGFRIPGGKNSKDVSGGLPRLFKYVPRSLLHKGYCVQAVDLPVPEHVPEDAKSNPGPSVSTVEIRKSFSRFDCGPGGLRPGFCRNQRSVPFPLPS